VEREDWTREILDAAAWEIVSRGDPFGEPVRAGVPRAAIAARLESELGALQREYEAQDAKYQALMGQFSKHR
jgi:hypothetical protein